MYTLKCVENEIIIDNITTENIEDVKKFFNKNRYFSNLENNINVINNMEISENLKFYKNRDRRKYIEVIR